MQKPPVICCKVTHYTLLVSESLVSRCESRSLLVAKHALYLFRIKSLLNPVKITYYSLQSHSLLIARFRITRFKIGRHSLQKMIFTTHKYQPLLVAKPLITCYLLQNRLLLLAKFICYSQKLFFTYCKIDRFSLKTNALFLAQKSLIFVAKSFVTRYLLQSN